jgi:hypothetical protein
MQNNKTIALEKRVIAVEIALQTHVLKTCPEHHELFCDDEVDPSGAFALAVDLIKQHTPYVDDFEGDAHELTDLLSATIGAAPSCCPACASARLRQTPLDSNRSPDPVTRLSGACECSGFGQSLLQGRHVVRLGQQEYARPAWPENELHVQPVT